MRPIKLELITEAKGNHNGTRIYWCPILVEVNGKIIEHDLAYFKGGNMTPGFTDSIRGRDIGRRNIDKVWGLVTKLVRRVKKKFQTERLAEDERRGQYQETVQLVVDEIEAAMLSGELKDHDAALIRASQAAMMSPYARGELAKDTIYYCDDQKTLQLLAERIFCQDVQRLLLTRPVFVRGKEESNG